MMMNSMPVKKVGTEKPTMAMKVPNWSNQRILAVGRIDADGQRDQDADQIGGADHRQGLRQALADEVNTGARDCHDRMRCSSPGKVGAETSRRAAIAGSTQKNCCSHRK